MGRIICRLCHRAMRPHCSGPGCPGWFRCDHCRTTYDPRSERWATAPPIEEDA